MWNSDFTRDGPGLLIKELFVQDEGWVEIRDKIIELDLDFFLLVDVDQDDQGWAAALLSNLLNFKHFSMGETNRGVETGFDLNRDDWNDANDNQGYGDFRGQHSMVLLARETPQKLITFNKLLLKDFSPMPEIDGKAYYSPEAWDILRVSPTGLWVHDFGAFRILTSYANTPAFDGAEKRNVLRNAAEIEFWTRMISGESFVDDEGITQTLDTPFILMGTLNLDPKRGLGKRELIRALLANPMVTPVNVPGEMTVDWREIGIGEMRVDYILPSCHFDIMGVGRVDMPSSHHLIWADIELRKNCNLNKSKLCQGKLGNNCAKIHSRNDNLPQ